MSKQERTSWALLILNLIVGLWYFSAVFTMGPGLIMGPQLGSLIARIVIVAIVIGIAGQIVMNCLVTKQRDAVDLDERDRLIGLKAFRNGYLALGIAVVILMVGLFVLTRLAHPATGELAIDTNEFAFKLDTTFIANLLLCALVMTEVVVQTSKVFYYRRGY